MRLLPLLVLAASLLARGAAAQPSNAAIADLARSLPPLSREAGVVRLPLTPAGPYSWRGVRDGISVAGSGESLSVSYRIAPGQPAGSVLIVPPGTLAGLQSLRLRLKGERNAQLVVTLRDASGVVYAFPAVPVRVGDAREAEVQVADLSYLGPASDAPDPGRFDPADAVMVMLLDLAGFMGSETPDVAWTLEGLEGVLQ